MRDEELKIEAMLPNEVAQRKGGQTVGCIPTGVKVTHIPTEMFAYCCTERSQSRNKNIALSMIEWGLSEAGWNDASDSIAKNPPKSH